MNYTYNEIYDLLFNDNKLIEKAHKCKGDNVGFTTYLRGLIEMSNNCIKDCLYCGIRGSNSHTNRYSLTDEDILASALYAYNNNYGSIAIQAGELVTSSHIRRVTNLVSKIKEETNGELGITLSLGEQTKETYAEWFAAGAERYLLRIETSSKELYSKLHPNNPLHSFDNRIKSLYHIRDSGYQLGTGVMIGSPFQKKEQLVDDLLFMKELDIDMCGMGPYLEHQNTPLYAYRSDLWSEQERFDLTIRMVATLRLIMPKINIAATTALQAIDPLGREKALWAGANVIMPNITPVTTRSSYKLYENKPINEDCLEIQDKSLFQRIEEMGDNIGFGKKGNSIYFTEKRT